MSSIQNIVSSNAMPYDLARTLGKNGIVEILDVMWRSYEDLHAEGIITASWAENAITQEWFRHISNRWNRENRAASVSINLYPTVQYEDTTLAKPKGQPPTIDFCFRAWEKEKGYFGAECKNLYDHDNRHIKRYVDTGVDNYTSGRYGSTSTVSSMVGYVLSGAIPDVVCDLTCEIAKRKPHSNLSQSPGGRAEQYQSTHVRSLDKELICLYHLFFNFTQVK